MADSRNILGIGAYSLEEIFTELKARNFDFMSGASDREIKTEFEDRDLSEDGLKMPEYVDFNALDEAAIRLQRGDISECLLQIERAVPRLDGLCSRLRSAC